MTLSVSSPEDVLNLALVRLGYEMRIGSIYEGSKAAKAALSVYAQTRDAVLREADWGFAEKIAAAATTGQTAPFPWTVEYTYPTNCLRLRNLWNAVYAAGDTNDPVRELYTIGNNAAGNKVIWCTAASATLCYTAQITNPQDWEAGFIEALVAALARRLGPLLAGSPDVAKAEGQDETATAQVATGVMG